MIAVRTQYVAAGGLPSDRRALREAIEAAVPLSAGRYNRAVTRQHTRERLDALSRAATDGGFEYRDTDAIIDEIPAAYKDIDRVMDDVRDLISVVHELRQIVNVKGDRSRGPQPGIRRNAGPVDQYPAQPQAKAHEPSTGDLFEDPLHRPSRTGDGCRWWVLE